MPGLVLDMPCGISSSIRASRSRQKMPLTVEVDAAGQWQKVFRLTGPAYFPRSMGTISMIRMTITNSSRKKPRASRNSLTMNS